MADARSQRLRKTLFYRELAALDSDTDDGPDPGRQTSENILRQARKGKIDALLPACRPATEPLSSLSDESLVANRSRKEDSPAAALASHMPEIKAPDSRQTVSSGITTALLPKSCGERKHNSTTTAPPSMHALFKGLVFYFFPNNDIAPARRMRISKAIEFGAFWQRDWNDKLITHVILDRDMTYEGLLKFTKLQRLPNHIIVVQENYPADCISYRTLLNPRIPQFSVKDHEPASTQTHICPNADPSLESRSTSIDPDGRATGDPKIAVHMDISTDLVPHYERVSRLRTDGVTYGDEDNTGLKEALQQARALRNVPIDDDDETSGASASEDPDRKYDDERSGPQMLKRGQREFPLSQDRFQCMHKKQHTGEISESPNLATIEILQQMTDYYGKTGDEWRVRANRRVIGTLKNHPSKVVTKEDALKLPNVGERLASKIQEIALTNRLQRLEYARNESGDKILQSFMQIYGVGLKQASIWIHEGYTSLEELLQKASLSDYQRIGIVHYEDFNSRIPRAKVETHGDMVRQAVRRVDPSFEVIVGGSYRRGAQTSGDIDCIITRPGADAAQIRGVVLDQVVPSLFDAGFLVTTLATSSRDDWSKWLGASRLPGMDTWRRLDLLLVPWDEMGAALIYFTGNDIFNCSLRLLARKNGMRLNQRGLYRDVLRDRSGAKLTRGTLIEGKDEERIFEILGVPWRPPEHREC